MNQILFCEFLLKCFINLRLFFKKSLHIRLDIALIVFFTWLITHIKLKEGERGGGIIGQ